MTYDYPIWYIFLSLLISGLLSFLMYRKNIKTSWKFTFMAFLRFLSLVLVMIALGSLMLSSVVKTKVKPKLVLAFDQSTSMLQNASLVELKAVFANFNSSKIDIKYNILNIGFGENIVQIDTLNFKDKRTDFESLQNKLNLLLSEKDRVVLISDGNVNKGNHTTFNTKQKYSLDVVGIGDTVANSSISITKINYNKKVVVGNRFEVEIFTETKDYSGNLQVEVTEEGNVIYSENIVIIPDENLVQKLREKIQLKSITAGVHNYKIRFFSKKDLELSDEKLVTIEFVKNKGVVLIKYKNANPDISLFKRELVKKNYKVIVSKNSLPKKQLNKVDFVVNFNDSFKQDVDFPIISVNSLFENQKKLTKVSSEIDKRFLKEYSINSKSKKIFLEINNLWQLNLDEVKFGDNKLEYFFESLLKEVKLLLYSDKFDVIYRDIYFTTEDVIIELVNPSSNVGYIEAKAEIVLESKKQNYSFIGDEGKYSLNLGRLSMGVYKAKIMVNSKYLETISFSVKKIDVELMDKKQNIDLLKSIAKNQNGSYFSIDNYSDLIDKLKMSSGFVTTIKTKKSNLVEQWWYLLLLPIILGFEWLLRKRNGLY